MGMRPKLRPKDEEFSKIVARANSGGGGDEKPASGGKGGGKSVNPMAKKGSADYKTMQKANAPDSFYGYYDQNTGDYVPWYIDIINGGGANQAGPQFEGGFGTARLAGGLLNAAGVSPYGQDRARPFMPMEAFRGGDDVPLRQAPLAAAPTGGGSGGGSGGGVIDAAVAPVVDYSPYGDAGFYDGMEVNRPVGQPQFPAQSYANMPMGELGRGTPMPTTGTADMPPELLPMFTIRNAYDDLFDKNKDTKYVSPDYVPQKKLIEYAQSGQNRPMSAAEYASLMPPTPVVDYSPYGDAGFYDGMEVNRPVAPEYRSMDQAVGGYQYPSMYRPMDRQAINQPNSDATGQPSFDEFMINQRALEAELGYPPMDEKYYQNAYQRFLTRTQ